MASLIVARDKAIAAVITSLGIFGFPGEGALNSRGVFKFVANGIIELHGVDATMEIK